MNHRFARVEDIRIGQTAGTISRIARDANSIARSPDDDVFIVVNRGLSRVATEQEKQQAVLAKGDSILLSHGASLDFRLEGLGDWIGVVVPRERLCMMVLDIDGMLGRPMLERKALGGLLASYAESVLSLDAASYDTALARHVETTLVDLIALSLGAGRDAADVARMRGLRAARLHEILAGIKTNFTDPGFSSDNLARRLGLSQRYVNDLLAETGIGFADRVMELRLQEARTMLANGRFNHLQVNEIAWACGFNEVPYFNRRFRARFGASPTQYRGGNGKAE